jgi:hypothetical protein
MPAVTSLSELRFAVHPDRERIVDRRRRAVSPLRGPRNVRRVLEPTAAESLVDLVRTGVES